MGFSKHLKLTGVIILIIDVFLWYFNFDIIQEVVQGRPWNEIPFEDLAIPIIVLAVGLFFILKKSKNEGTN